MKQRLILLLVLMFTVGTAQSQPMLYCDKISYIATIVMSARQAGLNKNNVLRAAEHWRDSQRELVHRMVADAWRYTIEIQGIDKSDRVELFGRAWLLKCQDWAATPVN